jgi:outer membrane PBP1 activator LpoA protein
MRAPPARRGIFLLLSICWLLALPTLARGSTLVELRERIAQGTPDEIVRQLQALPLAELERGVGQANNFYEQGWLELGLIQRTTSGAQQSEALRRWRRIWAGHPATALLAKPAAPSASPPGPVGTLGVVLPLSGPFQPQGKAVLAGVKAALRRERQSGGAVPRLVVFDSQKGTMGALLTQAAEQGVEFLLGPLLLDTLRALRQSGPTLPLLALNRLPEGGFPGYQLDLASDQELAQLVRLMSRQGHHAILVLAAADREWVEPLVALLPELALQTGVRFIVPGRVGATPARVQRQLRHWLGVQESEQRRAELQRITANRYRFSPRVKQDFDAVLLIVDAEQGRILKPLLNFMVAPDLPVYVSSHVFSTERGAVPRDDLEGVFFCDLPFRLRHFGAQADRAAFFALGLDAARIYRQLSRFRPGGGGVFSGETGRLRLGADNRFRRSLPCARLGGGQPVILTEPD